MNTAAYVMMEKLSLDERTLLDLVAELQQRHRFDMYSMV